MPEQAALSLSELTPNTKKTVTVGETKILLVRTDDQNGTPQLFALEAECPHAKAPLEKGAVCNGRLVCPWHTGTFALATGELLEPPPLRDLKRYPIRLQGDQVLVDTDPIPAGKAAPMAEGKHLVFAGAGAATAGALAYLRDHGYAGRITVVEPHTEEPADRTQLTKNSLSGKKPLDKLALFPEKENSLDPLQIERITARLKKLAMADRSLELDNGQRLSFDGLLLATGGRPIRPKMPGADLPHVFTIRHPDDLRRMEPLLQPNTRVALVGDSFIAFEAASALHQRGLHTTVIARSEVPFEKKFGKQVAEAMLQLHRSKGLTLHTGTEAGGITETAVQLSSGSEVPADLVILAVGVEPDVAYAPDLPKGKKGGFAVGRNLRLSPVVWCAGDIAAVDGTRIEHWRLAEQHGRTAAEGLFALVTGNAQGPAQPFQGVPLFWTTHFDKRFNYAGHAEDWDQIVLEGDPATLQFLAFYVKAGKVAAVLGCGHDTAIAALMEPMREPLSLDQAKSITQAAA